MAASFPVWVGGLALDVKEKVLLELFNKFGPVKNVTILRDEKRKSKQCGFVNFWSNEVAEAAALGMNGCHILGQVIETKSPKELTKNGQAIETKTPASQDKKDNRKLADCVYFIDKKDCPFKNGQCPYRHSAKALLSNTVCEKWKNKKCENVYCMARHPKNNTLKQQPVAQQPVRCPSHNAFKCTGECGAEDCDTHFMEMDAMVEHIRRGRERKLLPSGACAVCKAIFFSAEERKRHSCLNPKDPSGEPIKIPLYHPAPAYSLPTPHAHPQTTNTTVTSVHKSLSSSTCASKSVLTCGSCGNCYEHSGDSLSSFEFSPSRKELRGHKCPNSPSVRTLTEGQAGGVEPEPIGVFWDIENCPIPRGKSALDVVRKIREVFFTSKREVEFMCVCDISKEKKEVIEDLNRAQVTVVHINATSKNAADDKLRQSLRRFAQSYPPPATVILVSGDINFAAELSDLRHRHNLRVICLHNAQAQAALLAAAHETRRYDLFTASLPITFSTPTRGAEEAGMSSELTILNLPVGKDVTQIKTRLKKLSDNCGGRVISVTGRIAAVRFANHLSAARAKKRMDGEDVYGSVIQVIYSPTNGNSPTKGSPLKTRRVPPLTETQDNDNTTSTSKLSKFIPVVSRDKPVKPVKPVPHRAVPVVSRDLTMGNSDWSRYYRTSGQPTSGQPSDGNYGDDDHLEEFTGKPLRVISQSAAVTTTTQSHPNAGPYLNAYPPMWQHPYYHGVINLPGQGGAFSGMNPLTMPMMGAPHLTASWLASLHNFTVLDQQRGGIDLLVSNLDEDVSKKELKKKLASVFREHCKVYSVVLHVGEGMPLRAFIKVPKLSDAQIAMSKVNNQQIFNSFVSVTIATEKEKELCFLRCEITSVLKEAPLHWMPLTKFLSEFYEKCSHAFDMSGLGMLPDLAIVIGKPGSQAIGLVTHALGSVKVVIEPDNFAAEVHNLLKQYKGNLPLVNFAASYWIKFDSKIEIGEEGIPLFEALEGIPNVVVKATEDGREIITWAKPGLQNGGLINRLLELSAELRELLKAQSEFKLPLSQLISSYQKWFNRRLPFDPMNYGFSSVRDLLDALPSVVKLIDDGIERYVTLTQKLRVKVFEQEVRILLECLPDHALLLINFMTAYQKCFGHKCQVTDYGFNRLVDLMEAVKSAAKMCGTGDARMIYLVDEASYKANKAEHRMTLHILSQELKALLAATESHRLPVSKVMLRYYEFYGRHFKIGECGFTLLEDLLESISGVQMFDIIGEKYVSLPVKTPKPPSQPVKGQAQSSSQPVKGQAQSSSQPVRTQPHQANQSLPQKTAASKPCKSQLPATSQPATKSQPPTQHAKAPYCDIAKDIIELVRLQDGEFLSVSRLASLYRKQFSKRLPVAFNKLAELVESTGNALQLKGKGVDQILFLPTKPGPETKRRALDPLADDILAILVQSPDCCVSRAAFPAIYTRHKGHGIRPKRWGYSNVDVLLEALHDVVAVIGSKELGTLCLRQDYLLRAFARQMVHLLQDPSSRIITLGGLSKMYEKSTGCPLRPSTYGYSQLSELLEAITSVVKFDDEPKKRVRLSPLQMFAVETKQMLLQHDGCVSLNRFAPCFQQLYSRPCKAADYGYSRMAEVLGAIPHLVDVRGDGADKVVLLADHADVLLDNIGPELKKEEPQSADTSDVDKESCSESDTASVVVEEEVEDFEDPTTEDNISTNNEELIVLESDNTESEGATDHVNDWMMAPVPRYLPEPDLHPSMPVAHSIVGDLISFTEFDIELSQAGLPTEPDVCSDLSQTVPRDFSLSMDHREKGVDVGSSEGDNPENGVNWVKDQITHSSITPVKPRPGTLATEGTYVTDQSMKPNAGSVLSPGFYQLSEIEAEILNSSGSSSPVNAPPRRLTPAATGRGDSPCDSFVSGRGRKAATPKVKLAATFSMLGKK